MSINRLTIFAFLFALLTGCSAIHLLDSNGLYMSQKMIYRVAGQWDKERFHLYSFKPYTTLDTSAGSSYGSVGISLSLNEPETTITIEQARQWVLTLYSQVHAEIYQPFKAKGDLDPSRRVDATIHFCRYMEQGEHGFIYVTAYANRVLYYGTTPDNPMRHILLEEPVPEHLIIP